MQSTIVIVNLLGAVALLLFGLSQVKDGVTRAFGMKLRSVLATGTQGKQEAVVVWTNLYGKEKTRVFATTIGHNNATVEDARYLDLVAKGLLWATDKLDAQGRPKPGYGRPKK